MPFLLGVVVGASLTYNYVVLEASESEVEAVDFTLSRSVPKAIYIPALDVSADFEEPLGLNEDDQIDVPKGYDTVAWYQFSPTPGEMGPAIVLGHLDSLEGPEVFYKLRHLKKNDTIEILRADGLKAIFAVTELSWHRQTGFPTEAVYGDLDFAGLRLITCSGEYDHNQARYSHNLVVYAKLVAVR